MRRGIFKADANVDSLAVVQCIEGQIIPLIFEHLVVSDLSRNPRCAVYNMYVTHTSITYQMHVLFLCWNLCPVDGGGAMQLSFFPLFHVQ